MIIIIIIIIIIYLYNTSTNAEMYERGGVPPPTIRRDVSSIYPTIDSLIIHTIIYTYIIISYI